MITQQVAMVFTSRDLSQAGLSSVARNLLGVGAAFDKQGVSVKNNIKLASDWAVNNAKATTALNAQTLSISKAKTASDAQALAQTKYIALQQSGKTSALQLESARIAAARAADTETAAIERQRIATDLLVSSNDKLAASTAARDLINAGGNKGPSFLAKAAPGLAIGAAAITTVIAVDAIRKGLAFQGAEAQLAPQTGRNYAEVQAIGQAALNITQAGKSLYAPVQVLQGSLLALSRGISTSTISGLLTPLTQASAVLHQPNIDLEAEGLNSLIGYMSKTKKNPQGIPINQVTTAQGTQWLDILLRSEQETPAPPAELTSALPRLLSAATGTGISLPDLLGAETQLVRTTGAAPSVASSWLGQLIRSSIIKPTTGALNLATKLNIPLGAKGLQAAGGNPFVYWANLQAAIGNNPQLAAQLITGGGGGSGINAFRAFQAFTKPGALEGAAGLSDIYSQAGGTSGTAFQALQLGQQQKLTELTNKLNSDLTQVGLTINSVLIPGLTAAGLAGLDAAEGLVGGAEKLGHLLDKVFPGGAHLAVGLIPNPFSVLEGIGKLIGLVTGSGSKPNDSKSLSSGIGSFTQSQLASQFHIPLAPAGYHIDPRTGAYVAGNPIVPIPRGVVMGPAATRASGLSEVYGNRAGAPSTGNEPAAGRAYTQNLYLTAGAITRQMQQITYYNQSGPALTKFKNDMATLKKDITNNVGIKTVQQLRDKLTAESKNPALTSTGIIPQDQLTTDISTFTHQANTYINKTNYDAASSNLKSAQLQYQNAQVMGLSVTLQNQAARKVYQAAIDQASLSGLKPGSAGYTALVAGARANLKNSLGSDLGQTLTDAQARVTLAQDSGKGLPAAVSAMKGLLQQQLALGPGATNGISKAQYDLALYQLTQTAAKNNTVTPGPQLLRPTNAVIGSLTASFGQELSRINDPMADSNDKQLQMLEAANAKLETENARLRAIEGYNKSMDSSLKTLVRKQPGDAKQGPRMNNTRGV